MEKGALPVGISLCPVRGLHPLVPSPPFVRVLQPVLCGRPYTRVIDRGRAHLGRIGWAIIRGPRGKCKHRRRQYGYSEYYGFYVSHFDLLLVAAILQIRLSWGCQICNKIIPKNVSIHLSATLLPQKLILLLKIMSHREQ